MKVKYCGEEKQFSADKLVGMVMKQLVGSAKGIEEGIPVVMSVPRVWGEEEIASLRKVCFCRLECILRSYFNELLLTLFLLNSSIHRLPKLLVLTWRGVCLI